MGATDRQLKKLFSEECRKCVQKTVALFLALSMAASVTACAENEAPEVEGGEGINPEVITPGTEGGEGIVAPEGTEGVEGGEGGEG